jgi:CheY-like chemotaxis protein
MDNTILVVEDEPDLQEALALNLQNAGYRVMRAGTVRQAETLVNATVPQMVLLDWMLPDTPGLTFARRLRSEHRTAALPIILLTGRVNESDKITGLEAGADDYLIKPFSPRELLARIKAVMRRCAPQHADMVVEIAGLRLYARPAPGRDLGQQRLRRGAHGRRAHPASAPGARADRPQGPARDRARRGLLLPARPPGRDSAAQQLRAAASGSHGLRGTRLLARTASHAAGILIPTRRRSAHRNTTVPVRPPTAIGGLFIGQ